MLYSDSEVHDDVSPLGNPRHAAYWPGLYLSHVPGVPKLDIRVEGVSTDPSGSCITGGLYMYWEEIEREGHTNQGQLLGDWIGREDKGGRAWVTYHRAVMSGFRPAGGIRRRIGTLFPARQRKP